MHTNGSLLEYHRQNQELKQTIAGQYLFNQIQFFEKKNKQQIGLITETLNGFQKDFFEHDEVGTLQFDGVGKDRKPRLKEGKSAEQYTDERHKFLSIPTQIIFR